MPQPSLDFVQFLLDRDVIDKPTAVRIRDRSRNERTPIGQILVANGDIKVGQVMAVLDAQLDQPERRFGDLAVQMGFLSTVALERALRRQSEWRKHQISIIEEEKLVDCSSLVASIVAYVQLLEMTALAA